MAAKAELPEEIQRVAERAGAVEFGGPMTKPQIENWGRLRAIQERGEHLQTIVEAWKQQQEQDRKMRKAYASWLIGAMSVQVVAINVLFVLIGVGVLKFEPWTANTFVMATFAELGALILLVVKYLFPAPTDKLIDLIDRFKDSGKGD